MPSQVLNQWGGEIHKYTPYMFFVRTQTHALSLFLSILLSFTHIQAHSDQQPNTQAHTRTHKNTHTHTHYLSLPLTLSYTQANSRKHPPHTDTQTTPTHTPTERGVSHYHPLDGAGSRLCRGEPRRSADSERSRQSGRRGRE
ncbi:unnamed protein product [Gadus morhua 'NCC']